MDQIEVEVRVWRRGENHKIKTEWGCRHVYHPEELERFRGKPADPVKMDFARDIDILVEKVLGAS